MTKDIENIMLYEKEMNWNEGRNKTALNTSRLLEVFFGIFLFIYVFIFNLKAIEVLDISISLLFFNGIFLLYIDYNTKYEKRLHKVIRHLKNKK